MRRLDIAIIALVAATFGASVCATPTLAKPPVKKSSSKKKSSSRSRRDRNGCPPVRRTSKSRPSTSRGTKTVYVKTPPVTNTIIKDRVVKATIDQSTLNKLREDIIAGIKFPEMTTTKVDLSSIEARLTAQETLINSLIEQSKKDRSFDLRKTAHFEEQLCDILTLVKKQQECIEELCKKNGTTRSVAPAMNMAPAAAAVAAPAAIKPARLSIARDLDGNIFNSNNIRVQTGYDLGKFPGVPRLLGGDSALQVYADHFEVGTPVSGAGLAGRFYTSDSGKVRLYAGGGAGVYTTNFTQRGTHQTENGGKLFVGVETNRRSFLEFNVTSIQNYGPASRTAKVYFGQRF